MYGKYKAGLYLVTALLVLSSCATNRDTLFNPVDKLFFSGQYRGAREALESDIDTYYPKKDRLLFYLDAGMLAYYDKDYQLAIKYLNQAEDDIERLYTKRISQNISSYFTNDLAIDYDGETYEDLYCNIFKALSFMQLGDTESAFVELRRFNRKITIIQQRTATEAEQYTKEYNESAISLPELQLQDTALGRYMSFLLYLYDHDYDNAALDIKNFEKIFTVQDKVYNFATPTVGRGLVLEDGVAQIAATQVELDRPILRFLLFSGTGVIKQAAHMYFSSYDANNYAVVYKNGPKGSNNVVRDAAMRSSIYNDNHTVVYAESSAKTSPAFAFELPVMVQRQSRVTQVRILLDGVPLPKTERLESIDNIAIETFRREQPLIYFKTVMRVLVKEIVAATSLAIADSTDGVGSLIGTLSFITAMSLRLAEQADLRSGRFFPANTHVAEYPVAPGDYVITIEYLDKYGRIVYRNALGQYTVGTGLNLITDFSPQ